MNTTETPAGKLRFLVCSSSGNHAAWENDPRAIKPAEGAAWDDMEDGWTIVFDNTTAALFWMLNQGKPVILTPKGGKLPMLEIYDTYRE